MLIKSPSAFHVNLTFFSHPLGSKAFTANNDCVLVELLGLCVIGGFRLVLCPRNTSLQELRNESLDLFC